MPDTIIRAQVCGFWSLELASVIPHILPYFLFIEAIKFLFILPNFILINFLLILLKKRKEECKVNFCIFSWKPYQCTCICTNGDCYPSITMGNISLLLRFPSHFPSDAILSFTCLLGFHNDTIFLLSIHLSAQSVPPTCGCTAYPFAKGRQTDTS